MKKEHWFCTPIWFDYLDFDTSLVAKKCLQMKEEGFSNRVLSNVGGWQSVDITLGEHPEFHIVDDLIHEKIIEFANSIHPDYSFKLDNIWININEKGDYNGRHVHPVSSFSGTVYIQTDDNTGKIRFFNDFWMLKHYPVKLDDSDIFCQNVSYTPRNGMIIIFPSWIPHEVMPSESDMTRISMSFNIRQNY